MVLIIPEATRKLSAVVSHTVEGNKFEFQTNRCSLGRFSESIAVPLKFMLICVVFTTRNKARSPLNLIFFSESPKCVKMSTD